MMMKWNYCGMMSLIHRMRMKELKQRRKELKQRRKELCSD
jgi:hypothetical protein